jgi:hypothetical protein
MKDIRRKRDMSEKSSSEVQQPKLTGPLSPEEIANVTVLADDFWSTYSNHVRMAASSTEFRMFVGEHYPDPKGDLRVVEKFSIAFSPIQAKAILGILSETIQKYEHVFGKISGVQELVDKAKAAQALPAESGTN